MESNCCNRNDPVCEGEQATETIVWKPTGEIFKVCTKCAEAIIKRSNRTGGQWVLK